MNRLRPTAIRPPFGHYAHGIEIPPEARIVMTSGTLGVRPDDTIADRAEDQADQCFSNISAILAEAGMGPGDVVRINAFVTDRAFMADYMRARDRWLMGQAPAASTLVIVSGFTRPEFKVEVEVTAARVDPE